MAYTAGNLALDYQGGNGGAKEFSYITTDALATVYAADYFLADFAHLDPGDIIKVTVVDAVAPGSRTSVTGYARLMVATASSAGVTTTQEGVMGSVITLATTTTLTAAVHANRTILMSGAGSARTFTLPAATGSGNKYRFVVGAVNTSNYIINVTGNDVMYGNVIANSTGDTPDLAQPWPTAADSDTITLNGTTTGGVAIGDFIECQDIAADTYAVFGVVTASGTEATPFSAAVS